ncbi:hypothetical protein [Acanthamoeba castellanii mimivirus]|uniref:Uncharacterized protein n=3 Tax=Mimivirus TaxID=315393 RepID=E3VXH3_MIMIV|nr:hypothetical protein MIMI_gp0013 [Acanthamoeba polyphaga mimivirus]AEQ60169.1 hypothetical protein [Acanthamoeba castellanii mamavirus]AHA45893.1 hypothetical protein HIRU_S987 [Hirudovirus strain Sangsue]AHJ39845.1 hypothetical protein [Samba virus]BAV61081.1 hypothetical protein [Acanthamoeba castellanii mimivirus]ADO18473.1 hypothetical protein [Acanthamoeba polyphaga mimivirus]
MSKKLPLYSIGVPGQSVQPPPPISPKQPIFSSYTNKLIGYGHLTNDILCDAPPEHNRYKKNFHVIVYNPANDTYMAHDWQHRNY